MILFEDFDPPFELAEGSDGPEMTIVRYMILDSSGDLVLTTRSRQVAEAIMEELR
jgi:hypothetical protein